MATCNKYLSSKNNEKFKNIAFLKLTMEEELKAYGLSEKEIKIYVSCLKTGSITANRISELTGIRRSTVYEVIESLKKKGLIISFKKEKKYYFEASKPKVLIDSLSEKEKLIRRILPELNKISKSLTEKPTISLYEGKVGIRNAVNEMLNSKEILIYGASKEGDKIFSGYTSNFAQKRVERKILMKAIIEDIPPKHMTEGKVKRYTKIRTLKPFENHKVVYFIYNNNLLICTLGEELIAIKIKSPLLVQSQRIVFEKLWKISKKVRV